ncbi:MAG: methyltransferase domain-containing protein [Candidatus Eisenbacteria bacterium]|nr:methyltransferase domain-containing protein [Candidatus Eisenbacteria bacterium]
MRLNLGCGNKRLEGHFNIDIVATPATDLACDITRLPMFADGTAEEIRLEAVYEHLFRHERLAAIREWFRVLKPGGRLRVDWIPDFDAVAGRYVRREPGLLGPEFDLEEVYRFTHGDPVAWNAPEQIHKDLFTRASVERELREAGYVIESIENALFADEKFSVNLNVVARKPE